MAWAARPRSRPGGAAASRVVAPVWSRHAVRTNAAAARRSVSAVTLSGSPTPRAIHVPRPDGTASASPGLPSKPRSARKARSRSAPAPAGRTRPAKTGVPTAPASAGTSSTSVKVIGIGLLLGVVYTGGQELTLLPAGHGPQQVGQAVEVGDHR